MNGAPKTDAGVASSQVAITYNSGPRFVDDRDGSLVDADGERVGDRPRTRAVPELRDTATAEGRTDGDPLREGDGSAAVPGVVAESRRVITFDVLGTPAPKGSVRPFVTKSGKAVLLPSHGKAGQDKLRAWDAALRDAARLIVGDVEAPPFVNTPLEFHVEFRLARPGGHYSKATGKLLPSAPAFPAVKPDGDKLARLAADSLTSIVWDDDSRIVDWHIHKRYAAPGREGATITICEAAP